MGTTPQLPVRAFQVHVVFPAPAGRGADRDASVPSAARCRRRVTETLTCTSTLSVREVRALPVLGVLPASASRGTAQGMVPMAARCGSRESGGMPRPREVGDQGFSIVAAACGGSATEAPRPRRMGGLGCIVPRVLVPRLRGTAVWTSLGTSIARTILTPVGERWSARGLWLCPGRLMPRAPGPDLAPPTHGRVPPMTLAWRALGTAGARVGRIRARERPLARHPRP